MDIDSGNFFSALLAIVVIDLVLAGDNAIVIALATRRLPAGLQKKAIMWGTLGAIIVRATMTLAVVWLLMVPGLRFLGGLALIWIAYRLLAPKAHAEGAAGKSVDDFWGAMRTIVVADALMGLDNVLAVAGAARGSFLLVILGLVISIPIVVLGSTVILKWVARLPIIVYIGAAVLAWTAAQMMLQDPIAIPLLQDRLALRVAVYLIVVIGVLLAGILADKGRRRRSPEALRETL